MRRRAQRFLVVLALLCQAGVFACRGPAGDEPAPARDPQRQRVLDFWNRLNAATEARTRRSFAEAARLYEEALVLQPRHEDALYYLGQCRRELGQADAARVAFERLLEINPSSARGHLALGALLASPDPSEPMDLAEAERHLRRAHEINGEETGPVVRLGEVALLAGRSAEARRWFESALRTNPKSVEAAFLAGYLGWEEGQETAALVRRVREAAKVDAPVKGVLSEGDRRDAHRVAAPPLSSPLGRLLFGEPVERLRAASPAGQQMSEALVLQEWRDVRRLRQEHERRAVAPLPARR
jgi:tetratricopeptide (TPR) repeat protein